MVIIVCLFVGHRVEEKGKKKEKEKGKESRRKINRFWAGKKKSGKNGVRYSYMIPDVCGELPHVSRGERVDGGTAAAHFLC